MEVEQYNNIFNKKFQENENATENEIIEDLKENRVGMINCMKDLYIRYYKAGYLFEEIILVIEINYYNVDCIDATLDLSLLYIETYHKEWEAEIDN